MLKNVTFIAWLLLAFILFSTRPAAAENEEVWWTAALNEANREGYKLIDNKGLFDLIQSGEDVLILDARADYEFTAGHIPGSTNLEFDLGDKIDLPKAKREVFKGLMGSDKSRKVVLYCRSFR